MSIDEFIAPVSSPVESYLSTLLELAQTTFPVIQDDPVLASDDDCHVVFHDECGDSDDELGLESIPYIVSLIKRFPNSAHPWFLLSMVSKNIGQPSMHLKFLELTSSFEARLVGARNIMSGNIDIKNHIHFSFIESLNDQAVANLQSGNFAPARFLIEKILFLAPSDPCCSKDLLAGLQ